VSPRVFRVVALPAPTEREKSQMYVQRYLPHLPAAGEVVIWDRSWYNRAGVERVMGLRTEEQAQKFLAAVPLVRLLQGARGDVQGDRHRFRAVVRGEVGRQEAGTPEHHQPSPGAHSL
jgi:hypothetical protein